MDAALALLALWLAFAATHMGMSSLRVRPGLVRALGGELPFAGVYSLVALAIFVPLVRTYFTHKHQGPYLGTLSGVPGLRWGMYAGMAVAFALLVAGLVRTSPTSMRPGSTEVRGAQRVTRHPVFMAAGLFGLLHLCSVAIHATELAFFAGFPVFAVLGSRHQDARKLAAGDDGLRRFNAATSLLPDPRGLPALVREAPLPVAVGLGATIALRWFHPTLFGP
jgi:uncharacterized membrane protein